MAKSGIKFTGLNIVLGRYARALKNASRMSENNMGQACHYILGEAKKITPVNTGHLRGLSGVRVEKKVSSVIGIIWFGADYAPFVHESIGRRYRKGGPQFLRKALYNNRKKVIRFLGGKMF